MKKIITTLVTVSMLIAAQTQAADKKAAPEAAPKKASTGFNRAYGMAGCGLGSMIIGKKGGQIFAATTNGTSYNQVFGITFGSLNCVDSGSAEQTASRMDRFIVTNQGAIAADIARGQGETLSVLAAVANCKDQSRFNSVMQSNFDSIFNSPDLAPNEITDSIVTTIMNDSVLSSTCDLTQS